VPRPFGNAAIDGFDLDIESKATHMVPFANELRRLMDASSQAPAKRDGPNPSRYYLTAAPQCVYPDAAIQEMLDGAVAFDAIWVQFYNNFCGLNSFIPGSGAQSAYNFDVWDAWAKSQSRNPSVKVFIGMPGSPGAAGSGFVAAPLMREILGWSQAFSSFGGIMVWDVSQAYDSWGMLDGLKYELVQY
jgi:chitinase